MFPENDFDRDFNKRRAEFDRNFKAAKCEAHITKLIGMEP